MRAWLAVIVKTRWFNVCHWPSLGWRQVSEEEPAKRIWKRIERRYLDNGEHWYEGKKWLTEKILPLRSTCVGCESTRLFIRKWKKLGTRRDCFAILFVIDPIASKYFLRHSRLRIKYLSAFGTRCIDLALHHVIARDMKEVFYNTAIEYAFDSMVRVYLFTVPCLKGTKVSKNCAWCLITQGNTSSGLFLYNFNSVCSSTCP